MSQSSNADARAEATCPLRRAVRSPAQRPCAATEQESSQSAAVSGFAPCASLLAPPPLPCGRRQPRPPAQPLASRIAASLVRVGRDEGRVCVLKKTLSGGGGWKWLGKTEKTFRPSVSVLPPVPCRGPRVSEGGRLGRVWTPPGPHLDYRPVSGLP